MTAESGIAWPGDLDEMRRRQFRRVIAISAAAHVGAILVATFLPSPSTMSVPAAVTVDLVAVAPSPRAAAPPRPKAAPPAPAPKPEAAKPKPKPPPDKAVVLPKEAREPKPTPKPAAKAEPAPKPEAKPKPEVPQRSYADVMKDLKSRSDTEDDAPPAQVASVGTPTGGSTRGIRVDPATAAWMRDARIHVRKSWVLAPGFRSEALETQLSVELDSRGNVIGEPEITRRSGNPWYDDSVVRAIQKASPLPAPPEAGEWPFVFRPEETL